MYPDIPDSYWTNFQLQTPTGIDVQEIQQLNILQIYCAEWHKWQEHMTAQGHWVV